MAAPLKAASQKKHPHFWKIHTKWIQIGLLPNGHATPECFVWVAHRRKRQGFHRCLKKQHGMNIFVKELLRPQQALIGSVKFPVYFTGFWYILGALLLSQISEPSIKYNNQFSEFLKWYHWLISPCFLGKVSPIPRITGYVTYIILHKETLWSKRSEVAQFGAWDLWGFPV